MLWATIGVFALVVVLSAVPHLESSPIRIMIAGMLPIAFLAAVARDELRKQERLALRAGRRQGA